jgi:hypothetical protein
VVRNGEYIRISKMVASSKVLLKHSRREVEENPKVSQQPVRDLNTILQCYLLMTCSYLSLIIGGGCPLTSLV